MCAGVFICVDMWVCVQVCLYVFICAGVCAGVFICMPCMCARVCMERYDDNKPVDGFLYMYALYVCLICLLYIYIYMQGCAWNGTMITNLLIDFCICMPYVYALYVCFIYIYKAAAGLLCMYVLYVCLMCMPYIDVCFISIQVCSWDGMMIVNLLYMYALCVCLICLYALYVCFICQSSVHVCLMCLPYMSALYMYRCAHGTG